MEIVGSEGQVLLSFSWFTPTSYILKISEEIMNDIVEYFLVER